MYCLVYRQGCRALSRLAANESGFTAILTGLAATILMGFAALAVDVGYWQSVERSMQGAADQAAYSAAIAAGVGGASSTTDAKGVAAQMGFVDGTNNVSVAVNNPPKQGNFTSNNTAWEVVISQQQSMWFAKMLTSSEPTVSARAVAIPNATGSATACILALDPTAANALLLNQNATVPNAACGVASNSNASTALMLDNNATIAAPVNVVGHWTLDINAALNGTPKKENASAIPDPYSSLKMPASLPNPPCSSNCGPWNNNANPPPLTPGYYPNGWVMGNNGTINLTAGTYYVGKGITIGNNGTLNGTGGVTIVLTDSTPLDIGNNATIDITAPTPSSGQPYPGIALMGLTPSTGSQTFSNNTEMTITGAIYFPHDPIIFDNNAESSATGCTQIIGRTISLSNNVNIDDSACNSVGTKPMTFGGTPLVEE